MTTADRALHQQAHGLILRLARSLNGKKSSRDPDKYEWVRRQVQLLADIAFLREWARLKRTVAEHPERRIRELMGTSSFEGLTEEQRYGLARTRFEDEEAPVHRKPAWSKMRYFLPKDTLDFCRRFHITSMDGDCPEIRRARPGVRKTAYCPACKQPIPPMFLTTPRQPSDTPRPLQPYLPCPSCTMQVLKSAIRWEETKTYAVKPGDFVNRAVRKALGQKEPDTKRDKIKTSLREQYLAWHGRNVLGKSWNKLANNGSTSTARTRVRDFEKLIAR